MVQRKGPDITGHGTLPTKGQAKKEKPSSSHDASNTKEVGGGSDLKKKLKKARSIKRLAELGELDSHLETPQAKKLGKKPPQATAESDQSMTPARPNKLSSTPAKSTSKQQQPLATASGAKGGSNSAPPNYMKGTNSSDARKEQQRQVRFQRPPSPAPAAEKNTKIMSGLSSSIASPKTSKTSSSTAPVAPPPRIKKSDSIKKSAKMLTKKLSLKPIRSLMRKCSEALMFSNVTTSKPTCSSTMKDSKFPKELELNPGATEAEGTSAVKVCPFTYCSLNGHYHEPAPPLKRFLSMRRRSLKKQKTMKLRQLSVKRRGTVKGLKRAKSRKGTFSEVSPASELADDDGGIFVEIYDDPRGGNVEPQMYGDIRFEDGNDDNGKAKFQSTESVEVPSEGQEGSVMTHRFDDSNNTYMATEDNGEADFQSTEGAELSGLELKGRRSLKLRQLSVRRRSFHRSLKRAKSRRRASTGASYAVELPYNHGEDFIDEIYDNPHGGTVDPRLYGGNNRFLANDYDGKAEFGRTERAEPLGEGQRGAIKGLKSEDINTYGENDAHSETSFHDTKKAKVTNEGQKGAEQRFPTRPTDDSYTELSLDDNFDMVSEASFSETEVIEQFLEYIECLPVIDFPAEEISLPYAHKDRRRWDTEWDGKMAEDATDGSVRSQKNCSNELKDIEASLFDDFVRSMCESSTLIDPSCEIDTSETQPQMTNEAPFSMDDIYCSFNTSPHSQNKKKKETYDASEHVPEHFQRGISEEDNKEKGEESESQLPIETSEFMEADVIPAVTESDDKREDLLEEREISETGNKGCNGKVPCTEIQAVEVGDITSASDEAHDTPDIPKVIEAAGSVSEISTYEEATTCSLNNSTNCDSTEQLNQASLPSTKQDKDREGCEEPLTPVTRQCKPTAEDNYDMLARKAIENAVEEVYIYNVLKGSEGPTIIRAITEAITNPNKGLQGAQGGFKSRINITRSRAVQYLEKIRSFNPRAPNFLPLEPDPEAEKVDLRHEEMNEKKSAEEWMIDYALQQVLNKLAPAKENKVTLIVKAYEAVTSVPTSDHALQHEDASFPHTRSLQACS